MFKEFGLLLTHVPVDINSIIRVGEGGKNVHGHLHQNQSPTKHHINVSVEQIDYTPVNIDSIRAW
jgi:calcineurin-like phosphoesterase family protein